MDKDIILSPYINNKLSKGAYDSFPTGCVTDAALRKVAMLVTEPLKLNYNVFEDGKEIAIIDNNPDEIIEKIEYFYNNPYKLKALCRSGYNKIKEIYSFENQMEVRIAILTNAINNSKKFYNQKIKESNSQLIKKFLISWELYEKTQKRGTGRLKNGKES